MEFFSSVAAVLDEVSSLFSDRLCDLLESGPLSEPEIEDFLPWYASRIPPTFLPVVGHRDSPDTYALYVVPGRHWTELPWFELDHDGFWRKVASSLRYLPAQLFARATEQDEALWEEIVALAARIPTAVLPDRARLISADHDEDVPEEQERLGLLDGGDASESLLAAVDACDTLEEAQRVVEALARRRNDGWTQCLLAAKRIEAGDANAIEAATRALESDVPWRFRKPSRWFAPTSSSPRSFWRSFACFAAGAGVDLDSFAKLRDAPARNDVFVDDRALVDGLRALGRSRSALGDARTALGLARNAAVVSDRLSIELLQEIARGSETVEPGGLSATVARLNVDAWGRDPP